MNKKRTNKKFLNQKKKVFFYSDQRVTQGKLAEVERGEMKK